MSERRRLSNKEIAAKLQAAEEADLLRDPKFRRFLFRVLSEAGIFALTTFQRGDPGSSAYAEGRRSLGAEILHHLKHVQPDVLALIAAEGDLLAESLKPASPGEETDDHDLDA